MKHLSYQWIFKRITIVSLVTTGWVSFSFGEEPANVALPVSTVVATPVKGQLGLGKFLSRTMNTVAHRGKLTSKDPGAPEAAPSHKLFDPQRKESPIRTARLFHIQLNSPEEE